MFFHFFRLLLSSSLLLLPLCVYAVPSEEESLASAERQLHTLGLDGLKVVRVIDLASSDISSVIRLRDIWLVPLPSDPRVYVVEIEDPGQREKFLRRYDSLFSPEDESFRETGKTFYGRFVLVDPILAPDSIFTEKDYERVLSHELVHAYVMSCVGAENDRLPRWFHEGLATYLGQGGRTGVTQEYARFAKVFSYLKGRFGEEILGDFVRKACTDGEVSEASLAGTGAQTETGLLSLARSWTDTKHFFVVLPLAWAVLLFFLWATPSFRNPHRALTSFFTLSRRAGFRDRKARREIYRFNQEQLRLWKKRFGLILVVFQSDLNLPCPNVRKLYRFTQTFYRTLVSEEILKNLTGQEGQSSLLCKRVGTVSRRFEEGKKRILDSTGLSHSDPMLKAVLMPASPALRTLWKLPRRVRAALWLAGPDELEALIGIIKQWEDSESVERIWGYWIKRLSLSSLALLVLIDLFAQNPAVRILFPIVHWSNEMVRKIF